MSERQRRLEDGFFGASGEAVVKRADAFSSIDPLKRPGRSEGRVLLFSIVLGALLAATAGWLASTEGEALPTQSVSAMAELASAHAVEPRRPTMRPRNTRLAALLQGGEAAEEVRMPQGVEAERPAEAAPVPVEPVGAGAPEVVVAEPVVRHPSLVLADQRVQAEDFEGALAALHNAPAGFETDALRGHALYELGRDDEALKALLAAQATRPEHGRTLLLLGSLQRQSEPAASARAYRAFLAAHPDAPEASEVRQILEGLN